MRGAHPHSEAALSARADTRRYGLTLEEILPSGQRSVYVARVRTPRGGRRILKRARGLELEIQALRHWASTHRVCHIEEIYSDELVLLEHLDGPSFWHLPQHGVDHAQAIGEALRVLHETPDPDPRPPALHRRVPLAPLPGLDATFMAHAHQAHSVVLDVAAQPGTGRALHGDVMGANVFLVDGHAQLIDPLFSWGLAAVDLSRWAVTSPGDDLIATVNDLCDGYGEEPAGLWPVLTLATLQHLSYLAGAPSGATSVLQAALPKLIRLL